MLMKYGSAHESKTADLEFFHPPAKMSLSRIYNKIKPVGIKANDRKNKQINNRRCKL